MDKKRMLVVDDMEANRALLAECFAGEYTVSQAASGPAAIQAIEGCGGCFDIVLLDIIMPEMDGITVLKWLRASPYSTLPVIAVTTEPGYQLDALENGAWDFIPKPADTRVIRARVHNVLARHELENARRDNAALRQKQLEMDNLINSIPGGIAIYRLADRFEPLYFSDGVAELSGHTRQEYATLVAQDATGFMYAEDKKRLLPGMLNALRQGKPVDETYRIHHKNGSLVWVRLCGQSIGQRGGKPLIHAVLQRPSRMAQLYRNLVNESSSAIYVSDLHNYDLLYMNSAGLHWLGKEREDYSGTKCYEFLFGRTSPCPFCRTAQMTAEQYVERDYTYPQNGRTYHMRGKLTDWNGIAAHVEYVTDVSEERATQKHLFAARQKVEDLRQQAQEALDSYKSLVNAVPGGIALYEVRDGRVLTHFFSDGMCALTGYTRAERSQFNNRDAFTLTYPEDRPTVDAAIKQALATGGDINLTYRILTKSGQPRWVQLRATHSLVGETHLFHAVFNDVENTKRIEQELRENQLRYQIAIKSSGINLWEYDIQKDSLYVVSNSPRIKQNCFQIDHYTTSTLRNGYVRADSVDCFLSIFERLRQGVAEITEDIWYKTTDEAGFWCERVTYITYLAQEGKPLKAFGTGRDVTREKVAEKNFQEEIYYREALQTKNLATIKLNLTKNKVVDGSSPFKSLKAAIKQGNVDAYLAATTAAITSKEAQADFAARFNRKAMISAFNQGKNSLNIEITRLFDTEKMYWESYTAHLLQDTDSKEVIAYIAGVDITHEKVMQTIKETVTRTDYDFFVVVDGTTNSAQDFAADPADRLFAEGDPFEATNIARLRANVCPEDVERVVAGCRLENIWAALANGEVYKFNFSMREKNGEIRRKQLQFTKINAVRKTFLMTRIDVNSIYREQQAANRQLQQALQDAEQADRVKTEFLSRMSHDIRTPMNAVLCLAKLGLDAQGPEEAKDCLRKIESSGQYLLAIINDVLNLSKLQSGTISFHPVVVNTAAFIAQTIAIVQPAADEKGLRLVVKQKNITTPYLRLDVTYVRQVAVNLLSNAIKFTPPGGQVTLTLENMARTGEYVDNRLVVQDTGVGIGPEFLPQVFAPFAQENAQDDLARQGTGLGLSIVQNIVEQMGGHVFVTSKKGVGTTFTVEWRLQAATAEEARAAQQPAPALAYNLAGKRVLLVENHPLNTEIARRLLEKEKVLVTHAPDGSQAVAAFRAAAPGTFDAILMDIRMPVMNGLEATRAIRALPRPDAATIPIIAMTANAFDEDVHTSLEAGMNAHLAKPIDADALYRTLGEQMAQNSKAKDAPPEQGAAPKAAPKADTKAAPENAKTTGGQ
ncbi:MAG: response regulator [Gemmiger sp.]|nr:response regulator [Gemmiger sp.]